MSDNTALPRKNYFDNIRSGTIIALYVFHYPLLVTAAYLITTYAELPMVAVYLILLPFTFVAPVLLYEITSRIPVIRYLLLGM